MNPTLQQLVALADAQLPAATATARVGFAIYPPGNGTALLTGYYLPHAPRDRQAFAQAVGKLIATGHEVQTWRDDE